MNDRFALSGLAPDEFGRFYYKLIGAFGYTASTWYLIGTDSCHLCEQAQGVLHQACPDTPITILDLVNAPDDIICALGRHIPILLTPHVIRAYPFGIMDVMALVQTTPAH